MSFKIVLMVFFLAVITSSSVVLADEENTIDWGLDVSAGHQQQSFGDTTANLSSLSFDPLLQYKNWSFSLSVPWNKNQGGYYIKGSHPILDRKDTCNMLDVGTLTPDELKITIRTQVKDAHPLWRDLRVDRAVNTRFNTIINLCSPSGSSGVGDISGFTHYAIGLDDKGIWNFTTGLGYKTDSGDSELGLGTGTKETMLEVGVNMFAEKNSLSILLGNSFVSGDDDFFKSKNYAYASINLSRAFTHWLTLGASYSAQQANVEEGEPLTSATVYVNFTLSKHWNVNVYTTHYLNSLDAPDSEAGANLSLSF